MFDIKELDTIGPKERICYKWIGENIPEGKTILELGSGITSYRLSKFYTIFSI